MHGLRVDGWVPCKRLIAVPQIDLHLHPTTTVFYMRTYHVAIFLSHLLIIASVEWNTSYWKHTIAIIADKMLNCRRTGQYEMSNPGLSPDENPALNFRKRSEVKHQI